MKQLAGLLVGLAAGTIGTILYIRSMPPVEGSLEEKIETQSVELKKAEHRIAELENRAETFGYQKPGNSFRDQSRRIAADIRDGKAVDLNDVYGMFRPVMSDLSPLIERMRYHQEKDSFDTVVGNYSRKYDLTEAQTRELKTYLELAAEEKAAKIRDVVQNENSTFRDYILANSTSDTSYDADEYMKRILTGDARERFVENQMKKRIRIAQDEADRNLSRLNTIVSLDEDQKDKVFVLMARSSSAFDPSMEFGGVNSDNTPLTPGSSREEAILSVLRPEQKVLFEEEVAKRRVEADEELSQYGLKLPADWDVFEWDAL